MKDYILSDFYTLSNNYIDDYVNVYIDYYDMEYPKNNQEFEDIVYSQDFIDHLLKPDLIDDKGFTESQFDTWFNDYRNLDDESIYRLMSYFIALTNDYNNIDELKQSIVDSGLNVDNYSEEDLENIFKYFNDIY